MRQKIAFIIETGAETAQAAVGGQHPMTGDDDGQGIGPQGSPNGAGTARHTYALGQFLVGGKTSERRLPQSLPDANLKSRSSHVQGESAEVWYSTIKIGPQRRNRLPSPAMQICHQFRFRWPDSHRPLRPKLLAGMIEIHRPQT